MNLQEVMEKNGGFWDKEYAMIRDGQYVKCVAIGNESKFQLTDLGKTLVNQVANTSADVVSSEKKRGRKPTKPVEDLDLDDL